MPGYSWYVPKQNGWLNIGIGGMAERMKAGGGDIKHHWNRFVGMLNRTASPRAPTMNRPAYSYFHAGRVDVVRRDNAFITGDAARWAAATRDMAEGIGPAVRSGIRAAQAILDGTAYRLDDVTGASLGGGWVSRGLDWAMTRGQAA